MQPYIGIANWQSTKHRVHLIVSWHDLAGGGGGGGGGGGVHVRSYVLKPLLAGFKVANFDKF